VDREEADSEEVDRSISGLRYSLETLHAGDAARIERGKEIVVSPERTPRAFSIW